MTTEKIIGFDFLLYTVKKDGFHESALSCAHEVGLHKLVQAILISGDRRGGGCAPVANQGKGRCVRTHRSNKGKCTGSTFWI